MHGPKLEVVGEERYQELRSSHDTAGGLQWSLCVMEVGHEAGRTWPVRAVDLAEENKELDVMVVVLEEGYRLCLYLEDTFSREVHF